MKQNVLNYLLSVKKKKGAGYIVLIDPDKNSENNLEEKVSKINNSGVDAIFVGGSLILDNNCEKIVELIKFDPKGSKKNAKGGHIKDDADVSLTVIEIPDISQSGVESLFKRR